MTNLNLTASVLKIGVLEMQNLIAAGCPEDIDGARRWISRQNYITLNYSIEHSEQDRRVTLHVAVRDGIRDLDHWRRLPVVCDVVTEGPDHPVACSHARIDEDQFRAVLDGNHRDVVDNIVQYYWSDALDDWAQREAARVIGLANSGDSSDDEDLDDGLVEETD